MGKRRAIFTETETKKLNKAIMSSKKLHLEDGFDGRITVWVPEAIANGKFMPKIAATIAVGHNEIRIVANEAATIKNALLDAAQLIYEMEEDLNRVVLEQVEKWNNYNNSNLIERKNKVIQKGAKSNTLKLVKKSEKNEHIYDIGLAEFLAQKVAK